MTKWQAIELARQKYAEHPGTFLKLTPYRLQSGHWALQCLLSPICGYSVSDPATFDSDLQAILEAGRRWNLEDAEVSA